MNVIFKQIVHSIYKINMTLDLFLLSYIFNSIYYRRLYFMSPVFSSARCARITDMTKRGAESEFILYEFVLNKHTALHTGAWR